MRTSRSVGESEFLQNRKHSSCHGFDSGFVTSSLVIILELQGRFVAQSYGLGRLTQFELEPAFRRQSFSQSDSDISCSYRNAKCVSKTNGLSFRRLSSHHSGLFQVR